MRQKGSNGQRLDYMEKDIRKMKQNLEEQKNEFERHLRTHIIDDLQETRYNGKPLYSYADIADRHDVSKSYVNKIAAEEGLSRRNRA